MLKRVLHIGGFSLLVLASLARAQEPIPLLTWWGNNNPWESGTETVVSEGKIVPMIGACSEEWTSMLKLYPTADSMYFEPFQTIPEGATLPFLDVSMQSFIGSDSSTWVENWPTDGSDPVLHPLDDMPPAKWIFDFGGMRDMDQRWQWMMTWPDGEDQTSLWQISYSTPSLIAQFPGDVTTEPRLHETRVAGQVNDFHLRFTWPREDMRAMVVLDGGAATPDTVTWDETSDPLGLAWCPRSVNESNGTLYAIVQTDEHTYDVRHLAGDMGVATVTNFSSETTPRLLTTTGYQKTNLLDADFVAWVTRMNGQDVLHWARYQYQFGYSAPTAIQGQMPVAGSITRLRTQYAAGVDMHGPFDSWYIYWGEYDPSMEETTLYSYMADRDPQFSDGVGQEPATPAAFSFAPSYPNPFNASTVIPFDLARGGTVRISVVDLLGRRVALLADNTFSAGEHRIAWSPGQTIASGTYLVRLESGDKVASQRVVLVK